MPPLKDVLKNVKNPYQRRSRPLWAGPATDPATDPQGGVTQGMLSRYIGCRERFRVQAIEGVGPHEGFNSRLEFGNLWHVAEEALAAMGGVSGGALLPSPDGRLWEGRLAGHAQILSRQYPMDRQEIDHWHRMAKALFSEYVRHWSQHPDVVGRKPFLQEQVFAVPYTLPSGRVAWLRGKWDSVDLVPCEDDPACLRVWLQENKTKSSIHVGQLTGRLKFDLQTLTYLVALNRLQEVCRGGQIL